MRLRALSAATAAVLLLSVAPTFAQRTTATIRGTVTDQTKSVIQGAKVTARGEDTGFRKTTTTNATGQYSFTELPIGNYTIEVEYTGFKTQVLSKILLNVADVRAVDVELSTGDMNEQISVEASALQVKTIGGEVA